MEYTMHVEDHPSPLWRTQLGNLLTLLVVAIVAIGIVVLCWWAGEIWRTP